MCTLQESTLPKYAAHLSAICRPATAKGDKALLAKRQTGQYITHLLGDSLPGREGPNCVEPYLTGTAMEPCLCNTLHPKQEGTGAMKAGYSHFQKYAKQTSKVSGLPYPPAHLLARGAMPCCLGGLKELARSSPKALTQHDAGKCSTEARATLYGAQRVNIGANKAGVTVSNSVDQKETPRGITCDILISFATKFDEI
ncbi:hypothetical protein MHYP_G00109640 [Metynnis hypsauchen]